jgi:uncharacterized protein YciI
VTYFVVLRRSGPEWNFGLPLEQQSQWDEHADFMDRLVDNGFVLLGGPLAHDETRAILVVQAQDEDAVRRTLADDPWHESHLVVESVDEWTIRLSARSLAVE